MRRMVVIAAAALTCMMNAEAQEKELLLDPAFFQALRGHIAPLGDSDGVQTGTGRYQTEFGRFSS